MQNVLFVDTSHRNQELVHVVPNASHANSRVVVLEKERLTFSWRAEQVNEKEPKLTRNSWLSK